MEAHAVTLRVSSRRQRHGDPLPGSMVEVRKANPRTRPVVKHRRVFVERRAAGPCVRASRLCWAQGLAARSRVSLRPVTCGLGVALPQDASRDG